MNNIAIFILTHGRASKQDTLNTLQKFNCKTPIYLVVDNMDSDLPEYKKRYKNVIVFDKRKTEVDTMTNRNEWKTPVYARSFINEYAKENKIQYYMMLDDDIKDFKIRCERKGKLKALKIKNIDNIFDNMAKYMENTPIAFLGFVTSAAYIGGINGAYSNKIKRDISQAFMCKTKSVKPFRGVMNEDYIASLDCALNGKIALSIFDVMLVAPTRMTNTGGLHDTYENMSIYERDFYTCMAYPSTGKFVKELYYKRSKVATFPMIISERHKK